MIIILYYIVKYCVCRVLLIFVFRFYRFQQRRTAQTQVQPAKAQAKQEAQDAVHHATVVEPGEKVPGKTVPEHRRTGRVFQFSAPDRNAGKAIVLYSTICAYEVSAISVGFWISYAPYLICMAFVY